MMTRDWQNKKHPHQPTIKQAQPKSKVISLSLVQHPSLKYSHLSSLPEDQQVTLRSLHLLHPSSSPNPACSITTVLKEGAEELDD
jgi:hypothetical protein